MRGAVGFGADLAGLVNDRRGAVAGIFDDFALLRRRSAPGGHRGCATAPCRRAEITILRNRSSRPLILAISLPRSIAPSVVSVTPTALKIDRLARVRLALVGRAFAGLRAEREACRSDEGCSSDRTKPAVADWTWTSSSPLFRCGLVSSCRSDCDDDAARVAKEMPRRSDLDSGALFESYTASVGHLGLHARCDRGDHHRRHLELIAAVDDAVACRDPGEVACRPSRPRRHCPGSPAAAPANRAPRSGSTS